MKNLRDRSDSQPHFQPGNYRDINNTYSDKKGLLQQTKLASEYRDILEQTLSDMAWYG